MITKKLNFSEESFGNVKVFVLEGKMTGGPAIKLFLNRIEELVSENINFFVMNFSNVKWINSEGLGSLIACLRIIRTSGGDVYFANLNNIVETYFRVSRLETVVKIFDNVTQAVDSFSSLPEE